MSSSTTSILHRRKSSREDNVGISLTVTEPQESTEHVQPSEHSPRKLTTSAPEPPSPGHVPIQPYSRQRVLSTPSQPLPPTLYSPAVASSAGPYRTAFGHLPPPGQSQRHSFSSHTRSPSASSYNFYPPSPSPLSSSFSFPSASPTSPVASENGAVPSSPVASRPAPPPPRRHSRIHSRNLSIYFPRPGAGGPASIAEDGAQEVEIQPEEAPVTLLSAPYQQGREINPAFKFGRKKSLTENETSKASPESADSDVDSYARTNGSGSQCRPSRRGHHHKHSVSHDFFSFTEPGESSASFTSGAPTPTPKSSSFPSSPWQPMTPMITPAPLTPPATNSLLLSIPSLTALAQFCLGAWLWVRGQQCGSLTCTGLGYWMVFDSLGIICENVVPAYLQSRGRREYTYGNARIETLAIFAQSVYLIFASVYVCKEAVEHILLSHGEGHHHHRGDDTNFGIDLPILSILLASATLIATSVGFENNGRIMNATSNRLPSIPALLQSFRQPHRASLARLEPHPTTVLGKTISNPYTVTPVVTAFSLLGLWSLIDAAQQRSVDLFLSALLSFVTFKVAYPAALALGKVLLQTAPERGTSSGTMEAFLRVMRDLERHPQVLHLPPPHVWQLIPSADLSSTLVATLELHVPKELDDDSILDLTHWAWERCVGALGGQGQGALAAAEVTIGIVRG